MFLSLMLLITVLSFNSSVSVPLKCPLTGCKGLSTTQKKQHQIKITMQTGPSTYFCPYSASLTVC